MKANRGAHIDRISNLPGNVIDDILQHLPIRDVVRTSILSRKWRYMWVSVPRLEFGYDFFEYNYGRYYENPVNPGIITKVLSLHNGPVSKFTLMIPYWYFCEITCLSKWILFLSRSGVKYLELVSHGNGYQMPSLLFSCQRLTYLTLEQFEVSLPSNFCGFKSLLKLHLVSVAFESGALERLISGCPQLDVLTISRCFGFDSINVCAPCLKVLCMESHKDFKSICFKEAKNLTDLTFVKGMGSEGDNFEQISVSDLPEIERLCLRSCSYIKTLSTGIIMQMLQKSIKSLKYLELDGVDFNQSREILFIISLLKSSSSLVEIVIKEPAYAFKSYNVAETPLPDDLRALYSSRCCLNQLRKVNITVLTAYEHALDLIRFLLVNSSSLEILTFKVRLGRNHSDTPTLLSISEDLLQIGRASQRAQVKFLYDSVTEQ